MSESESNAMALVPGEGSVIKKEIPTGLSPTEARARESNLGETVRGNRPEEILEGEFRETEEEPKTPPPPEEPIIIDLNKGRSQEPGGQKSTSSEESKGTSGREGKTTGQNRSENSNDETIGGVNEERWARWLIHDKEEWDKVGNEQLKTEVRLLARRADEMAGPKVLIGVYDRIDRMTVDGKIKLEEAALWQSRITERVKELNRVEQERLSSMGGARESQSSSIGGTEALVEALFGKRLSSDEKFMELLNAEEWADDPVPPVSPEAAPPYYVDMIAAEKRIHRIRIKFENAAFFKHNRLNPPTLDTYSKYESWGGLPVAEMRLLYEVPGVKEALRSYVKLFDSNQQIGTRGDGRTTFSLRTAENREELMVGRKMIRKEIEKVVAAGYRSLYESLDDSDRRKFEKRGLNIMGSGDREAEGRPLLELKAREAEQIAFNLHSIGLLFESIDSQWAGDRRIRAPESTSDLVNVPLKNAMNPLDALISSFSKEPDKFSPVGKFGRWAYNMVLASNKGALSGNSTRNVVLLPEDEGNQNKFWTVDKRTGTLYMPECYPRQFFGSIWEETSAGNKRIIDYLREGQEIPWDRVSESMWTDYAGKAGKAGAIWDLLDGKSIIRWGELENVLLWVQEVNKALAKFGLAKEEGVKRWILYASNPGSIKLNSRAPKLAATNTKLDILSELGSRQANYIPGGNLLFPWDGRGPLD